MMLKKVVIIGPESTGKSTLCDNLARHYKTSWCPEYAREYLLQRGMDYTYDDLLTIAKGQVLLEDEHSQTITENIANPASLLFIDTDMYVMKIWSEFVFGKCHPFILKNILERKYDLYLLCKDDLPWISDELREYPDAGTRHQLFLMYQDHLINQSTPWELISGDHQNRFRKAIEAIETHLNPII
jgi:NadR type nicotinamide-nucleotide adenylyltransferase